MVLRVVLVAKYSPKNVQPYALRLGVQDCALRLWAQGQGSDSAPFRFYGFGLRV